MTDKTAAPTDSGAPKLSCDSMLGKLCRELRLLGLDVDYARGMSGMRAYHRARSRGRTLVTRNTRLKEMQGVLFIQPTETREQLAEVGKRLNIQQLIVAGTDDGQAFTRCSKCNEPLEKISRDQARPAVPFFIYQIHHDFRRCPSCKQVYWPGSHKSNMVQQRVQPRQQRPPRQRSGKTEADGSKGKPDRPKDSGRGTSGAQRQRRGQPRRQRSRRKPDAPKKT